MRRDRRFDDTFDVIVTSLLAWLIGCFCTIVLGTLLSYIPEINEETVTYIVICFISGISIGVLAFAVLKLGGYLR